MISLARINAVSAGEFVSALGGIYEHSDWVPRRVVEQRPFATPEELRLVMQTAVDAGTAEAKLTLIRAHPDLGGKLAREGVLTEESTNEQAGLGLDRLNKTEYDDLSSRNQRYREQFGFPFIICARLTTKQGILDAFDKRLGNSRETEISEALKQIHEIARLRIGDLIKAE